MIRTTLGTIVIAIALGAAGCRSRWCCPPCGTPVAPYEPVCPAASAQTEVFIDMTVMSLTPDELAGIAAYSHARGGAQKLSESDAASLITRFASRLVQAPKILVLSGQEATVSVGDWPKDDPGAWTGFVADVQLRDTATATLHFERIGVRRRLAASDAEQTIRVDGVEVEDGGRLLLVGQVVAGQHLVGVLKAQRLPPGHLIGS